MESNQQDRHDAASGRPELDVEQAIIPTDNGPEDEATAMKREGKAEALGRTARATRSCQPAVDLKVATGTSIHKEEGNDATRETIIRCAPNPTAMAEQLEEGVSPISGQLPEMPLEVPMPMVLPTAVTTMAGDSMPGAHAIAGTATISSHRHHHNHHYQVEAPAIETPEQPTGDEACQWNSEQAIQGEVVQEGDTETGSTTTSRPCLPTEVYEGQTVPVPGGAHRFGWAVLVVFFLVAAGIVVAVLVAVPDKADYSNDHHTTTTPHAEATLSNVPAPYAATDQVYPVFQEGVKIHTWIGTQGTNSFKGSTSCPCTTCMLERIGSIMRTGWTMKSVNVIGT